MNTIRCVIIELQIANWFLTIATTARWQRDPWLCGVNGSTWLNYCSVVSCLVMERLEMLEKPFHKLTRLLLSVRADDNWPWITHNVFLAKQKFKFHYFKCFKILSHFCWHLRYQQIYKRNIFIENIASKLRLS